MAKRLEEQMFAITVDFDCKEMRYSPDRIDALVWALTELMVEGGLCGDCSSHRPQDIV